MNILALDQGSLKSGFAIFKDNELIKHGIFDIKDEDNPRERIHTIALFLQQLVKDYKINLVTIEDVQMQKNPATLKLLSSLQSVLVEYLHSNNIPYMILAPSQWRSELKLGTGKRDILKQRAIKNIEKELNFTAQEDEAEAICIGLATIKLIKSNRFEKYIHIYE